MSKMLTGGVGLNDEYVTEPVAPEVTLIAELEEQAKTIVDPLELAVSEEHGDDSFALGAV